MKENKLYSDLDLNFIAHPLSGDIEPILNQRAIERAIRGLFFLNPFDIPFSFTKASSLKRYLFEDNTPIVRASLQKDMDWLIKKMEPRIKVDNISVAATRDGKGFDITVKYSITSLAQDVSFNFTVERVR